MSSGSTSPSAVMPLNRFGGTYSLVAPESSTAANQRYLRTTSVTAAQSAATDGVPTRSADSIVMQYSHNGNGGSNGAAQLYGYYAALGAWVVLDHAGASATIPLINTATQKSGQELYDIQGADRVYLRVSTLPAHASAATVDVWLLGRTAQPVTGT